MTTWTSSQRTTLVPPLSRAGNWAAVLLASALLAALAQLRVVLPFTPVPITGQTLGVLLVAAALGPRRGAAAVLAYLAEGLLGLPVFAGGGSGLGYLLGPTGGYLVGFVAAAWVVGAWAQRSGRRLATAWLGFVAGEAVLYAVGLFWLGWYVGWAQAPALGLFPFLLGDALKAGLAGLLLPAAWRLVR